MNLTNPEHPTPPRPGRLERALAPCCPEARLCDICSRRMCEDHDLQPAATCGSHVECVDCAYDNRCRDCRTAYREIDADHREDWRDSA